MDRGERDRDKREDRRRYERDRERREHHDDYRGRDHHGRDRGDGRRELEDHSVRSGPLCKTGTSVMEDRERHRARDRRDSRDRESAPRRRRRNLWDDTGGRDEAEVVAAQAQQLAMQQMWARANPSVYASSAGVQPSGRKQRELYVGNLAVGVVNGDMLKEFFSSILTQCSAHSAVAEPLLSPIFASSCLTGVLAHSSVCRGIFANHGPTSCRCTAFRRGQVRLCGVP